MRVSHNEIDLYDPVRRYFTESGYTVRGEVADCDVIAARKDAQLIAIELKMALNLSVIIQATQRQRLCQEVWIAVPRPGCSLRSRRWQHLLHLLGRLELGLLLVGLDQPGQPVEAVLLPRLMDRSQLIRRNKPRYEQMKREFWGRHGDHNKGGSSKIRRITVYREQALLAAALLQQMESASAAVLQQMGAPAKTWNILHDNHYHWFERLDRGRYTLTAEGHEALLQHAALVTELLTDQQGSGQEPVLESDSPHSGKKHRTARKKERAGKIPQT